MLFKIDWKDEEKVKKFLKENNISFEELDADNYADACPECGDSEFWHGGHCSHCGYDL